MYKVLFDITPATATSHEKETRLFIELGEHHLYLSLSDTSGRLLRVKYFVLDPPVAIELPDLIRDILRNEAWVNAHEDDVIVLYHFPENLLVPAANFDLDRNRMMLELVNGDLRKGSILSEKIKGLPVFNLFRVPASIHSLVEENFRRVRYWHFYSLHIEAVRKVSESAATLLWVTFYSSRLLVLAMKNNEVQSLQAYDYQQAEDAAFYLLTIAKAHHFEIGTLSVVVEGLIERDSSMFNELKKYFFDVSIVGQPNGTSRDDIFSEFPPHFFAPLQKLGTCV
jgi:Protein of unknown function (DUF3822)